VKRRLKLELWRALFLALAKTKTVSLLRALHKAVLPPPLPQLKSISTTATTMALITKEMPFYKSW
jgi:hypothetical protein